MCRGTPTPSRPTPPHAAPCVHLTHPVFNPVSPTAHSLTQVSPGATQQGGFGVVSQGSRPRTCQRAVQPGHHVRTWSRRGPMLQGGFGVVSQGSRPRTCQGTVQHGRHVPQWPRGVRKLQEGFVVVSNGGSARTPGAQELVAKLEAINSPAGMAITQCANCGALEAPRGAALKPCSRCKAVVYCGKGCQTKHWKAPGGHKSACFGFSA